MYKGFYHEESNQRRGPGIQISEDSLTEGWWPNGTQELIIRKIDNKGKITFLKEFDSKYGK